jgi:competence protein ComEC
MQSGFGAISAEPLLDAMPGAPSAHASARQEEGLAASRLKSPALFLAIAFALGIAAERQFHEPSSALSLSIPALITGTAACLLIGAVLVRARREAAAAIFVLVGFVTAGSAAAVLFGFRFPGNHLSNLESWGVDLSRPMILDGTIVSDPIRGPSGIEFDLEATELDQVGEPTPAARRAVTGRVRVIESYTSVANSDAAPGLRSGDRIRAIMRLRQPRVYRNPGSFDFRERAESIEDLYWEGSIDDAGQLHKLSAGSGASLSGFIETVRRRLRDGIDRLYPPWSAEGRDGAVLKAILLGDRSSLDSATVDHFRASGLYHLLVIAGLHVGLIAALILGLCRLLRLRRSARNVFLLVALLAYAFVVEQRAPTLRATLMLVAFILAELLGRDHAALNAVGVAALILLVARPAWLFESGFQLSFAAALLIVGLAAPILRATIEPYRNSLRDLSNAERDTALPPRQAQFRLDLRLLISTLRGTSRLFDSHPEAARRFVTWPLQSALWATEVVVFSALLQIGLLLPMVEEFHRVALAGVGLNAVALPLMGILLAVAIPTVILSVILPVWAVWPAKVVDALLRLVFALAELPHLPAWLSYRVPSPPVVVAVGFTFSLIAVALTLGRSRVGLLGFSAAFAAFAMLLVIAPFPPRLPVDALEVTALDCGRGEATALALPDRFTILLGACGAGHAEPPAFARVKRWDGGENIVSPYLWSRGVKDLGVVVLASAGGNLEGFVSVLENFTVGELWYVPTLTAGDSSPSTLETIFAEARHRGTRIREISAGEVLRLGTTEIEIAAASAYEPSHSESSDHQPFVMRVTNARGSTTLVLGGMNSTEGREKELGTKMSTTVLVADRPSLAWVARSRLLSSMSPALAIVAPGSNGREIPGDSSLPSAPLLVGVRILRTDVDGAVTVTMTKSSIEVRSFVGGLQKLP